MKIIFVLFALILSVGSYAADPVKTPVKAGAVLPPPPGYVAGRPLGAPPPLMQAGVRAPVSMPPLGDAAFRAKVSKGCQYPDDGKDRPGMANCERRRISSKIAKAGKR